MTESTDTTFVRTLIDACRPRRFYAVVDLPRTPRLALWLVVADNGELTCERLTITPRGAGGLTASELRTIPMRSILREVGAKATFDTSYDHLEWIPYKGSLSEYGYAPRRGKKLPDEHFREVARIYRAALAQAQPPTLAVAKAMWTSRANAGRWVVEARRRGFLGKAVPGKAGEKPPRKHGRT